MQNKKIYSKKVFLKKGKQQVKPPKKTLNQVFRHVQAQEMVLNKIHKQVEQQEVTLNQISQHVQAQEMILKNPQQHGEHQEETLNSILSELQRIQVPSQLSTQSLPVKSPFSLLDKIDLDVEKLAKIALFLYDLYSNSNSNENEDKNEVEQQEEMLNRILWELKRIQIPPHLLTQSLPVKSPFSLLDKLDLDVEKLTKIAIFMCSLYSNSNENGDETEQ